MLLLTPCIVELFYEWWCFLSSMWLWLCLFSKFHHTRASQRRAIIHVRCWEFSSIHMWDWIVQLVEARWSSYFSSIWTTLSQICLRHRAIQHLEVNGWRILLLGSVTHQDCWWLYHAHGIVLLCRVDTNVLVVVAPHLPHFFMTLCSFELLVAQLVVIETIGVDVDRVVILVNRWCVLHSELLIDDNTWSLIQVR